MKRTTKISILLALVTAISSWLLFSANGLASTFSGGEGGP